MNQHCVQCNQTLYPDLPELVVGGIHGRNPRTNRMAWMCSGCFDEEYGQLSPEQRDRYLELVQGGKRS